MTTTRTCHVSVTDLDLLRITCRSCQTAVEVPLEKLTSGVFTPVCPTCNRTYYGSSVTPLAQLADALRAARVHAEHATLEFVISWPDRDRS